MRRGRTEQFCARDAWCGPHAARSTRALGGRVRRRALRRQEIDDFIQVVTKAATTSPDVLEREAKAKRTSLASELRRYGEDGIASRVEALPPEVVDSIQRRAMTIAYSGKHFYLSMCLAAVEQVEGVARPLARRRRKSAT